MNSDAKMIIGIIAATVLVIGGGAWYASRTPAKVDSTTPLTEEQQSRLLGDNDPSQGPSDAKVTVVEFGDFQCPACGQLYPSFKQAKEDYKDQSVRFVYREFPLVQIHEYAQLAAEAALAAHAQGKFWEMHNAMFENQTNLAREDLEKYAEQVGLNMDEFRKALDERTYQDAVRSDIADGNAVGVPGTPTVFINGERYTGNYSIDSLKSAIDAAANQ